MSPEKSQLRLMQDRFPRVSGDEPLSEDDSSFWRLFSPRERG